MTSLHLARDVRWRRLDGEVVLVSQSAGEGMGFNDTASRLVELIGAGLGWEAVLDTLEREYQAPRAEIERDVRALVEELAGLGVLEER